MRPFKIHHTLEEDTNNKCIDRILYDNIMFNFEENYKVLKKADLYILLQQKISNTAKNKKEQSQLVQRCKDVIHATLNSSLQDKKQQIIRTIDDLFFEFTIVDDDENRLGEIELLKLQNHINDIQSRDIASTKDIVDLIDSFISVYDTHNKLLQQERVEKESGEKESMIGIIKNTVYEQLQLQGLHKSYTDNQIKEVNQTIYNEIDQLITNLSIKKMLTTSLQPKRKIGNIKKDRTKNALAYINSNWLYGQEYTTPIPHKEDIDKSGRKKYYGPMIDELLVDRTGYISDNEVVLNIPMPDNSIPDILNKDKCILFEQRCKSIISGDYVKEYETNLQLKYLCNIKEQHFNLNNNK